MLQSTFIIIIIIIIIVIIISKYLYFTFLRS
jgi:hypothetical protein